MRLPPRIRDLASSLLALIASPFTLVEQSRGRWRTALLVLYALLALVICTPLVRKARLSQIPDLGDPFDVAAFRDGGSDDAFPSVPGGLVAVPRPVAGGLPRTRYLYFNRVLAVRSNSGYATPGSPGLDRLQSRGQRPVAAGDRPARPELSSLGWCEVSGPSGSTPGRLSTSRPANTYPSASMTPERGLLRWLGEHEAMRLEKEGDLAGAWTWHNAALRYSRHVGMRTIFADRLQAVPLASQGVRPGRVVGLPTTRSTPRCSAAPWPTLSPSAR